MREAPLVPTRLVSPKSYTAPISSPRMTATLSGYVVAGASSNHTQGNHPYDKVRFPCCMQDNDHCKCNSSNRPSMHRMSSDSSLDKTLIFALVSYSKFSAIAKRTAPLGSFDNITKINCVAPSPLKQDQADISQHLQLLPNLSSNEIIVRELQLQLCFKVIHSLKSKFSYVERLNDAKDFQCPSFGFKILSRIVAIILRDSGSMS